jgi:phosphocarrier protein
VIEHQITIVNRLGLHARAAAKLVGLASQFDSDIHIVRDQREVNAKSIMGVMMLAASRGTEISLRISGDDETQALEAIVSLIENRFGEDE